MKPAEKFCPAALAAMSQAGRVRPLNAQLDRAVQLLDAVELERDLQVHARALDRRRERLVERRLDVVGVAAAAGAQERGAEGEAQQCEGTKAGQHRRSE
jgi:hypothetical protein